MNSSAAKNIFSFALLFTIGLSPSLAQTNAPAGRKTASAKPARARTNAPAKPVFVGSLQANDPEFNRLIPPEAKIEVIARGYRQADGLTWRKKGEYLVFSDVARSRLFVWKEGHRVKPFPDSDQTKGKSAKRGRFHVAGITLDAKEQLVLAGHADRRLARIEPNLTLTTLADRFDGKRLNSPNDLVYASNGDLFFTDPPYRLSGKGTRTNQELTFNGVYRLTPNGEVALLTKELTRPNGIALSPDERTLYVANADTRQAVWMAYPVKPDGTLDKGREFYDLTTKSGLNPKNGLPGGMQVDKEGNLFAAGPGGVYVISPAGNYLGKIVLKTRTSNCTWGDDGSTLYITTPRYVCRIKTATKGLRF